MYRGLQPDRNAATGAESHSALQAPELGKTVFVYRKTPAAIGAYPRTTGFNPQLRYSRPESRL